MAQVANVPHVSLLVAGELAVRVALHALQKLALQRRRLGGCWRVSGRRRIPVAGHLLAVRGAEWESGLAKRLAGDRGRVVRVAAFFAPRTLDRLRVDFGIVNGDNGMGSRFFCRETNGKTNEKELFFFVSLKSNRMFEEVCRGSKMVINVNVPYEGVALVLEHADFLDGAKRRECFLQDLFGQRAGQGTVDTATIDGAISRTTLIVHFVER